jgi:hypothetical protein
MGCTPRACQQPRCGAFSRHALGRYAVLFRAEIGGVVCEAAERIERPRSLPPGEKVRNRCAVQLVAMFRRDAEDGDDPIRIPIGQRSQKNGIHQREDGGVQADAQVPATTLPPG